MSTYNLTIPTPLVTSGRIHVGPNVSTFTRGSLHGPWVLWQSLQNQEGQGPGENDPQDFLDLIEWLGRYFAATRVLPRAQWIWDWMNAVQVMVEGNYSGNEFNISIPPRPTAS